MADPATLDDEHWSWPGKPGATGRGRGHCAVKVRVRSIRAARVAEGLPRTPPLPPQASAGKRWRFRRNLVIYVAHRCGLSQRLLADVFDLPRSRVSEIIKELRAYEEDR